MKKSKNKRIKDVVIACTERCNAKCRMCNIWKKNDTGDELKSSDFLYLPEDLTNVNISGGEPFLRQDLVEVVSNIRKRSRRAKIIISTNGFATKIIIDTMKELLKIDSSIGVVVSVDGIGDNHNKIRGMAGGFDRVLQTIKELKDLGVKTKIAFTIADYNYKDLENVYNLSTELGIEMSLALVHSSENYFSIKNDVKYKKEIMERLDWLMQKELSTMSPKKWLRAYFTYGLKIFLETGTRILPDYSGERSLFISSNGDVYPSDINNQKIGKLNNSDGFSIDSGKINNKTASWMICTTRTAIKKHFIKVGFWILKNKIKFAFYDRSNWFYYIVGLIFMALNKFRYFILGYHNPRPIAKRAIMKNILYSKNVINNLLKHLRGSYDMNFTFKGKDCLEIGPGSDFGTGLFVMSKGAKSYTGVDRFRLLNFNGDFYDVFNESLDYSAQERVEEIIPAIKKSILVNKKGEIELSRFKYVNTAFENIKERVDKKFDIIFSQAVLEHVYNPQKVFNEMYSNLKTGGVVIHEIDLATHTSFIRNWDPLNILRFSEYIYKILKFKGSPNRLRISEFKTVAEKSGFKNIKIHPLAELSIRGTEKIKKSIKNKYKDYSVNDLKVLSAVLIAEKND